MSHNESSEPQLRAAYKRQAELLEEIARLRSGILNNVGEVLSAWKMGVPNCTIGSNPCEHCRRHLRELYAMIGETDYV